MFALAIGLATPAIAQSQYEWTTNDGTITITGYFGTDRDIGIPETITGLPVTAIGSSAFGGASLVSVTIPESVTNIEGFAFGFCANLSRVYFNGNAPSADPSAFLFDSTATAYYLPDAVGWSSPFAGIPAIEQDQYLFTTNAGAITIARYTWGGGDVTIPAVVSGLPVVGIGEGSFYSSFGVTSVTIPESVTNIGDGAFELCDDLVGISVAAGNPSYSSADGVLFDKAQQTLITFPSGHGGSYAIPSGVTTIARDAFYGNFALASVTIPNGVTSIGSEAFEYCENVTNISVGSSVTNIGSAGFEYCFALTTVGFKGNAPAIASDAFTNDTGVTVYYLPGTTGWGPLFGGVPTVLWNAAIQMASVGLGAGQDQSGSPGTEFGFNVTGRSNIVVTVEAQNALAVPAWTPVRTFALTNGIFHFSEPVEITNRSRLYRLNFP